MTVRRLRSRNARSRKQWVALILASWRASRDGIIATGRQLAEAKAELNHGEWLSMVEQDLPFKPNTAQRLIQIAADARLSDAAHAPYLPPSWYTLYELSKLDDITFAARLADGTIHPDMQRIDIAHAMQIERRGKREQALAQKQLALPVKKYGVIVADPEWRLEPYSRATGLNRAADNHYPTTPTAAIAARNVAAIAANDCVLFLWATAPMLTDALTVLAAWGFAYCTHAVWVKDRIGTGYWFRNKHELLLVGTRGDVIAPAPGTQWGSAITARRGKHSIKPEAFLLLIEEYFPTLPKIELNRRGPPRPGWDAWGDEVSP